jgi:uncharacterized membrane protein YhiD involved in acid resistance
MSNAEMLLRLAVAAALGSVIGFERERLPSGLGGHAVAMGDHAASIRWKYLVGNERGHCFSPHKRHHRCVG